MLEAIKKLKPGDMITIDDPRSQSHFISQQDFEVSENWILQSEDGESEFIVTEIDDYYLIVHTLSGGPQYFIAEECEDVEISQHEDEPPEEITISKGEDEVLYIHRDKFFSEAHSVWIHEYTGDTQFFTHLFLESSDDECLIYRAIEIPDEAIVI